MLDRRAILVPVFLAAQAGFVYWASAGERPPAPPDFSQFPGMFGGWLQVREDPVETGTQAQLGADRLLSRSYFHLPAGPPAGLFVAWFRSQRGGTSQPHSPKVCLPGNGWTPEISDEITLDTTAGPVSINRYIVTNRETRAVVLYWYQTPRRVIAGEWAAKLWLVADALQDRRTDTALVRVIVWSKPGQDGTATTAAKAFARSAFPLLRASLPR